MLLYLSSEWVRNTVLTTENGQVMYKTSHPFHLTQMGTTTIKKTKPNADLMDMRDQFEVIGEIEWHVLGSSTFRINGQEMRSKDFLPSHGILGRKRTFTGPDGIQYRWDMPYDALVLSRDDGSKAEIVKYHRGHIGITGRKQLPHLEIHPEAMHMLDLIVLTFVYVEKIRMDKDRSVGTGGTGRGH